MSTVVGIGSLGLLVFLLVGTLLVYLAARGRARLPVLVLLVVALSPVVATALALFAVTLLGAFAAA